MTAPCASALAGAPAFRAVRGAWIARAGFTLIEMLVVIAVIAAVIGVLLPGLAQARLTARATACSARLQHLGVALTLYLSEHDRTLPQALGPLPWGGSAIIGALFGGTTGSLPLFGIDTIGAGERPLNRYVSDDLPSRDSASGRVELPAFRSPGDRGARNLPIPGFGAAESMYDLLGSSYTLNDHTLEGDAFPTLVPPGGGRMPEVVNPSLTWVLGTHTIYNFQEDADRGMRWFHRARVEASLLYVDMHARARVPVPAGVVHTTADYSFLPIP